MSAVNFKPGDRVRVLNDGAWGADVKAGDLATVVGVNGDHSYDVDMYQPVATGTLRQYDADYDWVLRDEDLEPASPAVPDSGTESEAKGVVVWIETRGTITELTIPAATSWELDDDGVVLYDNESSGVARFSDGYVVGIALKGALTA